MKLDVDTKATAANGIGNRPFGQQPQGAMKLTVFHAMGIFENSRKMPKVHGKCWAIGLFGAECLKQA